MNELAQTINNSLRHDNCPLCGSKSMMLIGKIEPMNHFSSFQIKLLKQPEYWRCEKCYSYFTQNIIPEETARALYTESEKNQWPAENFEKEKTKQLTALLKPLIKKGDQILDIGCNSGEFLDFAKNQGAVTFGVEYTKSRHPELRQKGHRIFSSIEEIPDNLVFDTIFAFDLVEHLYDMGKWLSSCRKRLKIDGSLIILTGNPNSFSAQLAKNRWWYLVAPEHLIFPSKKFFNHHSGYQLKTYQAVFNSKFYEKDHLFRLNKNLLSKIWRLSKSMLNYSYYGSPSLDRDHALVILNKTNKIKG